MLAEMLDISAVGRWRSLSQYLSDALLHEDASAAQR